MQKHSSIRKRLACAVTCAASLVAVPAAQAAVKADLRVVGDDGKTLVERTLRTGTVQIETDRRARCFGKENAGSGRTVKVEGPTALGIVADAAAFDRDLRPLSVTDAFGSESLAICGIGDYVTPSTGTWSLKHNHELAMVGGDQLRLRDGDEVLWWLDPDYSDALPGELALRAPRRARPGAQAEVKVVVYDESGERSPAEGANVRFGDAPTGADGKTTVALPDRRGRVALRATRAGDIPSNRERVCVSPGNALC